MLNNVAKTIDHSCVCRLPRKVMRVKIVTESNVIVLLLAKTEGLN